MVYDNPFIGQKLVSDWMVLQDKGKSEDHNIYNFMKANIIFTWLKLFVISANHKVNCIFKCLFQNYLIIK
jgi:hypothetical protein